MVREEEGGQWAYSCVYVEISRRSGRTDQGAAGLQPMG